MTVWVLTVEDRHTDPVVEVYATKAGCVAEFNRWLAEEVGEYDQERIPYGDGGESATWGAEGDWLRYEECEVLP